MIICFASTVFLVPSAAATSISPFAFSLPKPITTSILFFFIKNCTPLLILSATPRLRFITASKLGVPLASIPKSFACLISSSTWALFNNALVGIQPQFRQTPPRLSFSIIAVLKPNCDARIAAT